MSDKTKIVFKRTKENKQVTEAFIDGVKVGTIYGNKKGSSFRRDSAFKLHYEVEFDHVGEVRFWSSNYEDSKTMIRQDMARLLEKEII